MTSYIDRALWAEVPHGEKLVLVYLATQVNAVGVGLWDRSDLEARLQYKRRSLQRLLKSLRDDGLLIDHGKHWFQIFPSTDEMTVPEIAQALPDTLNARPATIEEVEQGGPQWTDLADTISQPLVDTTHALQDTLANFEMRLAEQFERAVLTFHENIEIMRELYGPGPIVELLDPVKASDAYQQLLVIGQSEEVAYKFASLLLKEQREERRVDQALEDMGYETSEEAEKINTAPTFADDDHGRALRIAHTLTGLAEITSAELDAWRKLEQAENRYTVKGEVDAFELAYPAIVECARAHPGMTLQDFIKPVTIDRNVTTYLWDQPAPVPMEDPALEAEIQVMLAELPGDEQWRVNARTVEKRDDGSTITEPIGAYHRRVTAKWQQFKDFQAM